jgi:hypothetical protein
MSGRRGRLVVALLVLCAAVVSAQRTSRRVFVAARDAGGAPVVDLTREELSLVEGGVSREVTRVTRGTEPMRIVMIVDSSSAMAQHLTHVRAGLNAFFEALLGDPELVMISTGGQLRVRVPPTSEREQLKAAAAGFAHDGGGNAFVDTLLEADTRFLKIAPTRWPVYVMLLTDAGESRGQVPVEQFNRFVDDFVARGGNAHAIILKGNSSGIISDFAQNLAENADGTFETMNTANALPQKMTALARRINGDHYAMATRWEIEYSTDAKAPTGSVDVRVARDGVRLQVSPRRPF